MRAVLSIAVVLVAVAGCSRGPSNDEIMKESEAFRPRREKEWHAGIVAPERRGPGFAVQPAPIAEPPAAPGPAYLAVTNVGIVTVDHGAATLTKLDTGYVHVIAEGRDGSLLIGGTAVYRLKDGAAEKLGGDTSPANVSAIASASDGKLWVVTPQDVEAWDGTAWTKHAAFLPPGETPSGLTIDGKDHVYVATDGHVFVFDGAWKSVYDTSTQKTEFNNPPHFEATVIGPDGKLYLVAIQGVFISDGKTVTFVEGNFGAAPIVRNGELLAPRDTGITHLSLATGKVTEVAYRGPPSRSVGDIDRTGRRWTTVDNGFAIVPNGAGAPIVWPAGSIPAISGSVTAVHVVGNGPSEVPGAGKIAKGTLRGVVTKGGTAIANAPVEICAYPAMQIAKDSTPCTGREGYLKSTTDAKGAFKIEAPLRDYYVVVQAEGSWFQLLGSNCAGMAEGDVCDVGELDLNNKL